MTKPVTGAATMALIEQGLIGLDEPVDRLLPELAARRVLRDIAGPLDDTVPAIRAITTRDLLTFTLGFGFVVEMFTAEKPLPIVTALVRIFSMAVVGFSNPLLRMTDSTTSTTPCPSRVRKMYRLTNPTASPPAVGKAISRKIPLP